MQGSMKAAVFLDVENIRMEERPIPECPKGGVLIKVMACGICGSDIRNYHNGLKDGIKNQVMGHEIAGEIVEIDDSIQQYKVGDHVALAPDVHCGTCWYCKHGYVNLCEHHKMLGTHYQGGFAQYIALPEEVIRFGFVSKVPEGMSWTEAAFAETCSAVIACQQRINVSLGQTVLIVGDGPVGCLHLEVARARGASKVIMIGRDKLDLAERFKPDLLLDGRKDRDELISAVRGTTDGLGVDVAICALPVAVVQEQTLEMLRKRGCLVIYGGVPKTKELSPLNSNLIHYGELTVTGAFSYPATGLDDALDALHARKIHSEMYINAVLPLERLVEGMEMVTRGEALKAVIDPWMTKQ